MNRQPTKPCKFCGEVSPTHWPYQCRDNPKYKNGYPVIKKKGKVSKQMAKVRLLWYRKNPPDGNGYYYCYLHISRMCPDRLLPAETTLDHLLPKGSHPELRYDLGNLFPCCQWCNTLKGSRSLKEALKLRQT